jgi:hypothetical protein
LLVEFGLDGVEQAAIDNGRLLALQNLALEGYFAEVEPAFVAVLQPTLALPRSNCIGFVRVHGDGGLVGMRGSIF